MKKWFRFAGALLLALVVSCGPKQSAGSPDTAFATYVKAYTGGCISEQSPVRIELATPVPMEAQGEGLFSFSPSLKGMTRWLSPTSVEFVPENFEPGKTYKGSFNLGKALGVKEAGLKSFPFAFKVAERRAVLTVDEIRIAGETTVNGTVTFSQEMPLEEVQKAVSVSYPAGKPAVSVTGGPSAFQYTVTGVSRADKDRSLVIKAAAKGFAPVSTEALIPAEGKFRVMDARVVESGNPHILIQFSEPLGADASAEGLIEAGGVIRSYSDIKDNIAKVYYEGRRSGDLSIRIDRNIKCVTGEALGTDFNTTFTSKDNYPAVEIPVSGNILPDVKALTLPLKAVNLAAVDVKIIRIYENNILTFLQDNDLDENSSLRRSGRLVCSKQVRLDTDPDLDLHQWNDFQIDLGGVIKQEPGAIYRIRVSFKEAYSLYGKENTAVLRTVSDGKPSEEEEAEWDVQSSYYWENFMDWDEYDWEESDDPTKPSYYMEGSRFPAVNVLSSNLGISAQYADGKTLWVAVTDLLTAAPKNGVKLEVFDYQLQRIGEGSTKDGLAEIEVGRKPFIVVARTGKSVGYLKLGEGYEKSFSRFDTGGAVLQKGLKGFAYGERGVWRPGDTLHVTLLVGDRDQVLPKGHPASVELYTPEGRFYTRMVQTGMDGFYAFAIPTAATDPTGYWNAYFKVGGSSFHKGLHIETIKPNRLKINLDLGTDILKGGTQTEARIASNWLTGPAASSLKAKAEMTLTPGATRFPGFEGYIFRNPAANFTRSEHDLFETRLNEEGKAIVDLKLPAASGAPGMLNAFIVTSVEESGGDESFTTTSVPYSPFKAYVGVKFPESDYLETDTDHVIGVVTVDPSGKRLTGRNLEYKVYKLDWKWWWESRSEQLDSYVNSRNVKPILSGTLTSGNQDASFKIRVDYPEWGRYLVFVRDTESGHASGKIVTIDWPAYRGRADRKDPDALTMLTFSTDKQKYLAGEKATVYIPAARNARALVSLENGSRVISRTWVSTDAEKDTPFTFKVTGDMAPNFYVHVTLVQPYGSVANDLPLRLYGVQRVLVDNPESKLEPVIKMNDTIAPEEEFTVSVSEKSGREMTYTLAIVDEGLLDITAFKTPSPWDEMYRAEALGVRTYDLYDQVIGAFSGRFSPMLSVGGDQENIQASRKDNRFNPVVKFLGPFTAGRGGKTHKIKLPMYVGSVRVMVVAGHEGAYGSAEKAVTVKAPLMVLSTLPRAVATGETVTLPVNVFAMEEGIREATASVSVEGPVRISGASSEKLTFSKVEDKIARFTLETTGEGIAKITVNASGAGHKASETIALEVSNPNPETVRVESKPVRQGGSAEFEAGEGSTIELATFPAVDALGVYSYMKGYPYDCTEQLASRGLALLNLIPMLPEAEAAEAKTLIPGIISKIYGRQHSDGGFLYWPSGKRSDSWVSSMVGCFLSQAAVEGYPVQRSVLAAWGKYQSNLSQAFRLAGNAAFSEMDESYRLYSLAVANSPLTGAMNRLKESGTLDGRARWILAAAYAVAGKGQTAKEIIGTAAKEFDEYDPYNLTYGSATRDKAIALEVLALTGDLAGALPLAGELAESFGSGYYNTQEAAFTAIAMNRLHGKIDSKAIVAEVGGKQVTTAKSVYGVQASGKTTVKNNGEGLLYATLVNVSKAPAGTKVEAAASGIKIDVSYATREGKPVDVKQLRQGTEFVATVTVTNPGARAISNLALRERIPSGWEIQNERLRGGDTYGHQDIRDNGCNWFFDLGSGSSKTFKLTLRAAYEGTYTLPSILCEAMYEPRIAARTASATTQVTR